MTAQTPAENRARRYAHIDAMRAFAVMIVVVAHAGLGHIIPGGSGVTIFFTISGFIITLLVLRERDREGTFSVRRFYFRRAAKIFPPFIIAVVVPSAIWAVWHPDVWMGLLTQLLFVFNWAKPFVHVLPGTEVVWSLSIEEQFYIVFALVWILLARRRYWRPVLSALALFAVVGSVAIRIAYAAAPGGRSGSTTAPTRGWTASRSACSQRFSSTTTSRAIAISRNDWSSRCLVQIG